jgi:hypothetical protein
MILAGVIIRISGFGGVLRTRCCNQAKRSSRSVSDDFDTQPTPSVKTYGIGSIHFHRIRYKVVRVPEDPLRMIAE